MVFAEFGRNEVPDDWEGPKILRKRKYVSRKQNSAIGIWEMVWADD